MTLPDLSASLEGVEEPAPAMCECDEDEPTSLDPKPDGIETVRVALACAYDGTAFHGFAVQRGQRTVAGELERTLQTRFGTEVHLTCAGRTDAGVHTLAQVVHIDVPIEALRRSEKDHALVLEVGTELTLLARSLSSQLGPEINVWSARVAPVRFDARRSATARRYRYVLETEVRANPLRAKGTWHVGESLDIAAMRIAADMVVGEHDFSGFCRHPEGDQGPLRRRVVETSFDVSEPGRMAFEIEAQSFCHQMVRSIVGLLVEVGRGRRRPSEVLERLRSGSRDGAPTIAPANGLCLVTVRYPDELGGTFA